MKTLKLLLVATTLAAASVAPATSMVPANLAQIVQHTEKAFVGRAVSTNVVDAAPQGSAEQVTFLVTEPILGAVNAGDSVTWLQTRSSPNDRFPGMPEYKNGEEYTVFLSAKAPGSQLQAPIALGQGSFTVHRDSETGKAYARNEFANASLFTDIDTETLSATIVDTDAKSAGLDGPAKEAKAKSQHASLHSLRDGGIDLDSLKNAAKALKAAGKSSQKFVKKGGSAPNGGLLSPTLQKPVQ